MTMQSLELMLAHDVTITPLRNMPDMRDTPGVSPTDVVIDRTTGRSHSKLASAELGALLDQFKSPKRLPDAIAAYAQGAGDDPFAVLEHMAPVIQTLRDAHILVPADQPPQAAAQTIAQGEQIDDWTVRWTICQTEDTQVCFATNKLGQAAAIKAHCSDACEPAFAHETELALSVRNTYAPAARVIQHNGKPVLVTDWIEGLPITTYAKVFCHTANDVKRLCVDLLEKLAGLHADGILHGDIKPSNFLVDADGEVWIIDFGMSDRVDDIPTRRSLDLRYLEPEAANALSQDALPHLTEKGEIFAIAALLAELVRNSPIRTLPALQDDALRQIADNDGVDFAQTRWPALNAVLTKALARDPRDRFPTVTALRDALMAAPCPAPAKRIVCNLDQHRTAPRTDLAYVAQHLAIHQDDPDFLAQATACLRQPVAPAPSSPLQSPIAKAVQRANLAYHRRDFTQARKIIPQIAKMLATDPRGPELFDGTAGALAHASRLIQDFQPADEVMAQLNAPLTKALDRQRASVAQYLDDLNAGKPVHLGMAHGLAGQTYACLHAMDTLGLTDDDTISQSLETIAHYKRGFGCGIAWPGTINANATSPCTADFMPGWCNGAAGFVMLWIKADQVLQTHDHLSLATGAAHYAAGHPDTTPNLCCGLSGRGIALAMFGQHINNLAWQQKAQSLIDAAQRGFDIQADQSLFRGRLGPVYANLQTQTVMPRFPI